MQIFIDPNTNQVMAVYKGCRSDPASWPGLTEAEAPDTMPASRDLKVTLGKDGKVTAWAASENPIKPTPKAPSVDPRDAKIAALESRLAALEAKA